MADAPWFLEPLRFAHPGEWFACGSPERAVDDDMILHPECAACRIACMAAVLRGDLDADALQSLDDAAVQVDAMLWGGTA